MDTNVGNDGRYELNEVGFQGEHSEFTTKCEDVELQEIGGDDINEFLPNEIEEIKDNVMRQDDQGDVPPEPYIGMEFDSDVKALMYYNAYAKCVGFSTRIGRHYKSKLDKRIISRDYFCSREGYSRSVKTVQSSHGRPVTRDGCKAMLTIKRRNDRWIVTKFEKNHNHALATPSNVHLLRSHRTIPGLKRRLINSFSESDTAGIMNIFLQSAGGVQNVRFTEQYSRTYVGQSKLGAVGVDAHTLLNYLKRAQTKNSTFFYAVQVDEDYAISTVFWVDARSRSSYIHFSDVVLIDTTYKRKGYRVPFVSITGVNHHRQSISFGCALLSDESESTFNWLFETWLEAMHYRRPNTIITDQDNIIRAAVAKVFPESRHRFCKWRILDKIQEKLSNVVNTNVEFQQEIEDIVNNSDTMDGFQEAWQSVVEKYKLEENQWLRSLYIDRTYWVPVYLKDVFFAGISSYQQNESIKSLFDLYIHKETTLNEFIKKHEKALEDQYEKEMHADLNALTNRPTLKTPLPIEEQASKIYTHSVFNLLQEEIVQSFVCNVRGISDDGSVSTYVVKAYGSDHKENTVSFNLTNEKGECNCKMFIFDGILCRHVLAVSQRLNVFQLPSHCILKRWTKDAKQGNSLDSLDMDISSEGFDNMSLRYDTLCEEAFKCVEDGSCSIELFHLAMRGLQDITKNLSVAKKKIALLRSTSNLSADTALE